jgi:CrcB protein
MHIESQVISWAAVALGGALGALGRYGVVVLAGHFISRVYPYGTLTVNLLGSFLLGLLLGSGFGQDSAWGTLLGPGVLGAFTTFSAFALDAVTLARRRQLASAVAYVLATLVPGLGAFALAVLIASA